MCKTKRGLFFLDYLLLILIQHQFILAIVFHTLFHGLGHQNPGRCIYSAEMGVAEEKSRESDQPTGEAVATAAAGGGRASSYQLLLSALLPELEKSRQCHFMQIYLEAKEEDEGVGGGGGETAGPSCNRQPHNYHQEGREKEKRGFFAELKLTLFVIRKIKTKARHDIRAFLF